MYAIIASGSKQYRVAKGDVIDVELLKQHQVQDMVTFEPLLLVDDNGQHGRGRVEGQLLATVKGPKVIAYRYRRRKGMQRKVGHRQRYSRVRITAIGS